MTTLKSIIERVFGCHIKALALFRIFLASLLFVELVNRFRYLHVFYSGEGTHPLRLLRNHIDPLYQAVCLHCYNDTLLFQQTLLTLQVIACVGLLVGYRTSLCAAASWFLYISLTLRNTWLNFILDRYFHYMLFYCAMIPSTGHVWSVDSYITKHQTKGQETSEHVTSLATFALKCQVIWIYVDAGCGKFFDPMRGWTWNPEPPLLPALDAYTRHTIGAQYMYGLLGPAGLKFLSPIVVWVEMLAAPVSLLGLALDWSWITNFAIGMICQLHIGIAITVRNTVLLSLVACTAWMPYLPNENLLFSLVDGLVDMIKSIGTADSPKQRNGGKMEAPSCNRFDKTSLPLFVRSLAVLSIIGGSLWFELLSEECNQSMKHIWSVLLHNRWNVFISSEEYVTWEIAPGRLADGSVVDVWGKSHEVNWDMPGAGAPCTSTSRPGRWRSFPYLAELQGEEGYVLWQYLCDEWNREHGYNSSQTLLRYNFFMLQSDVLPNMGFSPTRKRLIHQHSCVEHEVTEDDEKVQSDKTKSPEEPITVENDREGSQYPLKTTIEGEL